MIMFTGTPSAGSGGEAGKNKKLEEWTNKCSVLLKSMLDALSVLYDGIETSEDSNITEEEREQSLELKDEETISMIAQAFIQHCQKLVWMISEPTHGSVRLPLGSVLSVISRCLRVSYSDVRSVPSMSELAGLLPSLHRAALEILSQLVLSCKTSLLPQSRTIIDLCLQALRSAGHMDISEKSQTKACAYQALHLIVQVFGWGLYLTHQSKSIIQELIADIKWQGATKQTSATATEQTKQETVQGSRKRGKKKKNRPESYSDLAKTKVVSGEKSTVDDATSDFKATVAALELSHLMLGRAEFLSMESLMRCILDITQVIQREEPPTKSPFTRTVCRRVLYSAVFACSTVKLDPGCCRKDSITHFQMTNLALSLLKDGIHKDHSPEVQTVCKDSLNTLLVTGNLNRPIVRRIQSDENSVTKDVTELERDIDNAREETANFQKRLIDSELESQSQKRLIASFRQEIATLKERATTEKIFPCAEQKVYLSDPTDYRDMTDIGSEDFCENEFEKEESDDEKNEEPVERISKLKKDKEDENVNDQTSSKVLDASTVATNRQAGEVKESLSRDSVDGHSKLAKRKCFVEERSEAVSKRSRTDCGTSSNTDADCIQEMISDFVDADPDIA